MPRQLTWRAERRATADQLAALGVQPPVLAQLLLNRGIVDPEQARRFLHPEEQPLGDPFALDGVPAAVDRLLSALANDETIAVYGDYDVDGLTGAALLTRTLCLLGARVLPFIPHRLRDGYGVNRDAVERLRAAGASVVVTVDCGITAHGEVEAAARDGLDFVVTDHHHVPAALPSALAVINPRRPETTYPERDLSGAGVAFTLARALLARAHPGREPDDELFALATLGTLADLVPLRGENRTIVRRGLAALNRASRPGLRALARAAGFAPGRIDADAVCFALAPRLNAAGRLDDARLAFDLLVTDSDAEAAALAARLNALNQDRQRLTDEAVARARLEVVERQLDAPALVLAGPYLAGIVGLVAARLAEEFYRPAIVVEHGVPFSRGSARSVPGFSVVEALADCAPLLARWGGHAQAAGFTIETERLPDFTRSFIAAATARLGDRPPTPELRLDCRLRPSSLRFELVEVLRQLEPFGPGNPRPVFLTERLEVRDLRPIGNGHLRLRLSAGGPALAAVHFRANGVRPAVGDLIDLAYELRLDEWNDTYRLELRVVDWRPTERAGAATSRPVASLEGLGN